MKHVRSHLRIISMLLGALGLVVIAIGISSTVADAGHKDGHTTGPDCEKTPQATPCQNDNMPGNSGNTVACSGPAATHNPHCAPSVSGDDGDTTTTTVAVTGDDDDDTVVEGAEEQAEEAPEVLGVTVEPEAAEETPRALPEELAFTGSSPAGPAFIGLGLMLLGIAAFAEGRVRRATS